MAKIQGHLTLVGDDFDTALVSKMLDGGIGQAAAAGHQRQRQDSADCLAQTGAVLGLIFGCGGLGIGFGFKFLGDVIFRVVVVKGLHRDSSLRFICLYHNPHL